MLHLENKREVRLFEIIRTEGTEIERVLKVILGKYDNVVSRRVYDIENCQTIKHTIKLLNEIPVVEKQDH